jgi:hypothetical protein
VPSGRFVWKQLEGVVAFHVDAAPAVLDAADVDAEDPVAALGRHKISLRAHLGSAVSATRKVFSSKSI